MASRLVRSNSGLVVGKSSLSQVAAIAAAAVASLGVLPPKVSEAAAIRVVTLSGAPIPDATGSTATAAGVVFGTGSATNPFSNVTTNALGQVAFQSVLTGTGVDTTNNNGIWSEGSGSLKKIQRENDAASGTSGSQLSDLTYNHPLTTGPSLSANGATAFFAQMKGTGIVTTGALGNQMGLFSDPSGTVKLAVRHNDSAPGTSFSFQPSTSPPVQNPSGMIAFAAVVTNGTSTYPSGTGSNGVWKVDSSGTVIKVAALNDPAAGTTGGLYYGTSSFGGPVINSSGSVAFAARLAAGGDTTTGTNDFGIWSDASGSMKLVARRGDTANGTAGALFSIAATTQNLTMNNAGVVAFVASLSGGDVSGTTNNQGIWRGNEESSLTLVARKGSPAAAQPSGVNYSDFSTNLTLNKNGRISVSATLTGTGITTSNDTAIYTETGGGLSLVAQEGSVAPGSGTFFFTGLSSLSSVALQSNASDHVAFRVGLSSAVGGSAAQTGLFAQNDQGVLELIARTGDLFQVAPGDSRTISAVTYGSISSFSSGGEDGRISSWNDQHQIGFTLTFTDGTSGVFVATVPEPASASALLGVATLLIQGRKRWRQVR